MSQSVSVLVLTAAVLAAPNRVLLSRLSGRPAGYKVASLGGRRGPGKRVRLCRAARLGRPDGALPSNCRAAAGRWEVCFDVRRYTTGLPPPPAGDDAQTGDAEQCQRRR